MNHIKLFEDIDKKPINEGLFNIISQKIYGFAKRNLPIRGLNLILTERALNWIQKEIHPWLSKKEILFDDGYYYLRERDGLIEFKDAKDLIDCCILKFSCYTKIDDLIITALDYVDNIDTNNYLHDFYSLFTSTVEKDRPTVYAEVENIGEVLDNLFEKTDYKKYFNKRSINISGKMTYKSIKALVKRFKWDTFVADRGLVEMSIMYRDFELFMIAYSDLWGLIISESCFFLLVTYFPQEIIYWLISRRDRHFLDILEKNLTSFVPRMVEYGAWSIFEEFIEVCKEKNWDLEKVVDIVNGHSRLKPKTGDKITDTGRKNIFKVLNTF